MPKGKDQLYIHTLWNYYQQEWAICDSNRETDCGRNRGYENKRDSLQVCSTPKTDCDQASVSICMYSLKLQWCNGRKIIPRAYYCTTQFIRKHDIIAGNAFVLTNFLSVTECNELIKLSEDIGYREAPVNMGKGKELIAKHIRNNERINWTKQSKAEVFVEVYF